MNGIGVLFGLLALAAAGLILFFGWLIHRSGGK